MTPIDDRLRVALKDAMRARDRAAVDALRTVLGAMDNATAMPAVNRDTSSGDGPIAGAAAGVGATEVARRELAVDDVEAIVRTEIAARRDQADEFDRLGQTEAAERLRAEAAVLAAALDGS